MSVREAFRRSVNLVFIRLMRDIVNFHVFRVALDGRLEPDAIRRAAAALYRHNPARRALLAFEALCLDGLARVDFFVDKRTGKIWFNEVNTIPG